MAAAGIAAVPAPSPAGRYRIADPGPDVSFQVERLLDAPIIQPGMDARLEEEEREHGYANVNGPSLIAAPPWIEKPLGKYYLYFAHHKGEYIRLAYSDDLRGPWKTYVPGALDLRDSHFATRASPASGVLSALGSTWRNYPPSAAWAMTRVGIAALTAVSKRGREGSKGASENKPHIASPDVIVDHGRREVRMYYHGMMEDGNQMTRVALSSEGLSFEARPELLTSPYLRVFPYRGIYYGMSMPGLLVRSRDGLKDFETRPGLTFGVNMRHCALLRRGERLLVFFSRVGDAPERVLCSVMDISHEDWRRWKPSAPVEVLRAERPWEGASLPVSPSIRGEVTRPENQLRDPAVFEEDGKPYLLYSVAGESGIGIASLTIKGI